MIVNYLDNIKSKSFAQLLSDNAKVENNVAYISGLYLCLFVAYFLLVFELQSYIFILICMLKYVRGVDRFSLTRKIALYHEVLHLHQK